MAENGSSEKLTAKQETMIAALVAGHTIQTAAKAANVSERQAHRWLLLPHFQSAYKAAQKAVFNQALQGLMLRVDKAIEALDKHMSHEDTPPGSQIRAAQIILEQAISVHKTNELEAEIEALKQALDLRDLEE